MSYLAISWGKGPMFLRSLAQSLPSTYSITMHRCLLLSKLQYIETTKGLSVKVRMSLSANTCSTWNVKIKYSERLHLKLLQRIDIVFSLRVCTDR